MDTDVDVAAVRRPTAPGGGPSSSRLPGQVGYWGLIAAVYGVFGPLWFFAAKEKLVDASGAMPAGLREPFSTTWMSTVPGLDGSWLLLGLLQALLVGVLVASVGMGEFLPGRSKSLLALALVGSVLMFGMLAFGQGLTANHEAVASLFTYAACTLVFLVVVLTLLDPRGRLSLSAFDRSAS